MVAEASNSYGTNLFVKAIGSKVARYAKNGPTAIVAIESGGNSYAEALVSYLRAEGIDVAYAKLNMHTGRINGDDLKGRKTVFVDDAINTARGYNKLMQIAPELKATYGITEVKTAVLVDTAGYADFAPQLVLNRMPSRSPIMKSIDRAKGKFRRAARLLKPSHTDDLAFEVGRESYDALIAEINRRRSGAGVLYMPVRDGLYAGRDLERSFRRDNAYRLVSTEYSRRRKQVVRPTEDEFALAKEDIEKRAGDYITLLWFDSITKGEDVGAIYRWLLEHDTDKDKIVIAAKSDRIGVTDGLCIIREYEKPTTIEDLHAFLYDGKPIQRSGFMNLRDSISHLRVGNNIRAKTPLDAVRYVSKLRAGQI